MKVKDLINELNTLIQHDPNVAKMELRMMPSFDLPLVRIETVAIDTVHPGNKKCLILECP